MAVTPGPATTVLVVDDDAEVREFVCAVLTGAGHAVLVAGGGGEAIRIIESGAPIDLVLLDLVMPEVTGLDVLERASTVGQPVILLTGLAGEEDRARGLEVGADDYVVKPFATRELIARVDAVLRRSRRAPRAQPVVLHFDDLTIDVTAREVVLRGSPLDLPAREFDLLAFLAASPGQVFTRAELLSAVWHSSKDWQQERTVTEHVRRLRHRIEDDPDSPRWVETVRKAGYRFHPPASTGTARQ